MPEIRTCLSLLAVLGLCLFPGCLGSGPKPSEGPSAQSHQADTDSPDEWPKQAWKLADQGRFDEAAKLQEKHLAWYEARNGPDDHRLPKYLNNLYFFYEQSGELAKADLCVKRCLAIMDKVSMVDQNVLAVALYYSCRLYYRLGDRSKAEAHGNKALHLLNAFRSNELLKANVYKYLGMIYTSNRDYKRADYMFKQAYEIRTRILGERHILVGDILKHWGRSYFNQKKYDQAEDLYHKSLKITEEAGGPEHPFLADSLRYLGKLAILKKDYTGAEKYLNKGMELSRNFGVGAKSPFCYDLGWLYAAQNSYSQAFKYNLQAQEIDRRIINGIMDFTSAEEKMKFLANHRDNLNKYISLVSQYLRNDHITVQATYDIWLKRKGLTLEVERAFQEALIDAANPEAVAAMTELNQIRTKISRLVFTRQENDDATSSGNSKSIEAEVAALEKRINDMEVRLSRLNPPFALNRKILDANTAQVAANLSAGSVLLDFARYRPFNYKVCGQESFWGNDRYLVFIVKSGSQIQLLDLGSAEDLEKAINQFKAALLNPQDRNGAKVAEAASRIYQFVIVPLREFIEPGKQIYISPDGALNLIPFEVLQAPNGRYLIEDFSFVYLSSGRDVLGFQKIADKGGPPILVGDPDFDLYSETKNKTFATQELKRNQEAVPAGETTDESIPRELRGLRFSPLPGTKAEVQAIASLLGPQQVGLYTGPAALEEIIRKAQSPRILHIATHGYFLNDVQFNAITEGSTAGRALSYKPLLRSGLALAGANQALAGNIPDGLLSAEKVLGLRLQSTDLVVLSACDTGLGQVEAGEGVFGLRRAFTQAGAKGLVMSMWSVPDQETQELMVEFYRNMGSGHFPKAEALRQASLQEMKVVRDRYGHTNPLFWGAFIFMGQP